MNKTLFITSLLSFALSGIAQQKPGATVAWTSYEAENMLTNGTIMGPAYKPYLVETESSGQKCVKLSQLKQFVAFTASSAANRLVIRYSLPDDEKGNGTEATLTVYNNRRLVQHAVITSHYSWLYGKYPFTNDPAGAVPRNFYNEVRLTGITVKKGDVIRIEMDKGKGNNAAYCIIDIADLENIAPPLKAPPNSLSVSDSLFLGKDFSGDYTEAFKKCIAKAVETGKIVWIPAGNFTITGDIVLPANITIQGAGMWYSNLVGIDSLYKYADKRVRLKGNGSNIHLADFAICGKLNYRNDNERNDGIVGSFGINSTISRLWIEHTKTGMWIENSYNLTITGCRLRNTIADGINFCVGMSHSTIENCTARGTGDDCFAIWPTTYIQQQFSPGHNIITHCSAALPFLANGAAIYGGESNAIKSCSFIDISQGSAILISTTFPTESKDKSINNNFSGITLVENCDIKTSGGFDHDWGWRAAVEICIDKKSISGLELNNLHIDKSFSNVLSVIAKTADSLNVLSNVYLNNIHISTFGIGVNNSYPVFVSANAHGSLTIKNGALPNVKNESINFRIMK